MKKSFKYILLILMISFIIAILCCRDHSFEQYASYPFKEDEKNTPSIDSSLQEIIFKYNTMVDEQRAGGIQSNERGKINKGKKVYQPLTDNQSTEYAEYESILDNTLFKKERRSIISFTILDEIIFWYSDRFSSNSLNHFKALSIDNFVISKI